MEHPIGEALTIPRAPASYVDGNGHRQPAQPQWRYIGGASWAKQPPPTLGAG
jgi:hypothetical protein